MIDRMVRLAGAHGDLLREALGYVAVSAAALLLDISIYWLLLGGFSSAILPAAVGYSCGLVLHYALASRLVFASRHRVRGISAEAPTFAKYAATGVAGIVMTTAIVGLFSDILGWSALTAKLIATGFAFVSVFLARRFLVFGGTQKTAIA